LAASRAAPGRPNLVSYNLAMSDTAKPAPLASPASHLRKTGGPSEQIAPEGGRRAADGAVSRRGPAAEKVLCERCGAEMFRMHAVWRCPACRFKTDCCGW
jgi:hypothetical protein